MLCSCSSKAIALFNVTVGRVFPRGVLLYGPPGVGKSHIAHAVAGSASAHVQLVSGHQLLLPTGEEELQLVFAIAREKYACGEKRSYCSKELYCITIKSKVLVLMQLSN